MNSNLLLIDGLNFLRRIYEAIPHPDSDEKAQGAIKATCGSIRKALEEFNPSHVLVAIDHGGTTWRHDLYPEYKAGRKPTPEPLANALPSFKSALEEMGLCCSMLPFVEADDVIGTACKVWLKSRGANTVTILSSDKDFTQLVCDGVNVLEPFKREPRNATWIFSKYGVKPEQVLDFFSLVGDSSDGVPGVPGIGVKTAAKLLESHKTLDCLLASPEGLPGRSGKALVEFKEQALLSKVLISLKTDVMLGITWNDTRYEPQAQLLENIAFI